MLHALQQQQLPVLRIYIEAFCMGIWGLTAEVVEEAAQGASGISQEAQEWREEAGAAWFLTAWLLVPIRMMRKDGG